MVWTIQYSTTKDTIETETNQAFFDRPILAHLIVKPFANTVFIMQEYAQPNLQKNILLFHVPGNKNCALRMKLFYIF